MPQHQFKNHRRKHHAKTGQNYALHAELKDKENSKKLAGVKYEINKFCSTLNRMCVKGIVFRDEKDDIVDSESLATSKGVQTHYCTNKGHFFLNSSFVNVRPLHRCPTNVYKYYRNLRTKSAVIKKTMQQLPDQVANNFKLAQCFVTSYYFKSINTRHHNCACFSSIEEESDNGFYGVVGNQPVPIIGMIGNIFDYQTNKVSKIWDSQLAGKPFCSMLMKHVAWILRCLCGEELGIYGKAATSNTDLDAVNITNISPSGEVEKLLTGSCEIYEYNQAYECDLPLGSKTWVQLAGPEILHLRTNGLSSDLIFGLKVTINIKTYTYRFYPSVDCHTNTFKRLEENLSKQTVLFQEIVVSDIHYYQHEEMSDPVLKCVDDQGQPLSLHFETVNKGYYDYGKYVATTWHDLASFPIIGFVFDYGLPMQYELTQDYTSAYSQRVNIPTEITQLSCLKAVQSFWGMLMNQKIDPKVLVKSSITRTERYLLPFNTGIDPFDDKAHIEFNVPIKQSIAKNFAKNMKSKQTNKDDIWEIHPASCCTQRYGFLVQGPLCNNFFYENRATSVFLQVEVGTADYTWAPAWDGFERDAEGKYLRRVHAGQELDLDEILKEASRLSIFDEDIYMQH